MIKKESLDKIAQAFWERPKRKKRFNNKLLFLIIFIFLIITFIYFLSPYSNRLKPETKVLTFDLGREIIRINYNFKDTDFKTERYTINLGELNLTGFKRLEFSCRKAKQRGEIFLKVELENSLKERSHLYIPGIKNRWHHFSLDLKEFKEINDWGNITKLSFIIEEWNVQEKSDTVYIDEISFKRERR